MVLWHIYNLNVVFVLLRLSKLQVILYYAFVVTESVSKYA